MPRSLAVEILSAIVSRRGPVDETGPSIDRSFDTKEFHKLEIAVPFDVEIMTGEPASIQATGPEAALSKIIVNRKDDRLFITSEGRSNSSVSIRVCVTNLTTLRISGSGDVRLARIANAAFECASTGSGDLFIHEAELENLKLSAGGSGDVSIDRLRCWDAEAIVMGSGDFVMDAVRARHSSLRSTVRATRSSANIAANAWNRC